MYFLPLTGQLQALHLLGVPLPNTASGQTIQRRHIGCWSAISACLWGRNLGDDNASLDWDDGGSALVSEDSCNTTVRPTFLSRFLKHKIPK